MTQTIGELNVDIVARLDKLDAQFKKAEGIAAKAGERIEGAVSKGGLRGIGGVAIKVFAALAVAEASIKAATAAALAFQGKWSEALAAIERLPLGIGPVITATKELAIAVVPYLRRLKEANAELERMKKLSAEQVEVSKTLAGQRESAKEQLARSKREGQLIGLEGADLELAQINQRSESRIKELKKQLAAASDVSSVDARKFLTEAIGQEQENVARRRANVNSSRFDLTSMTFGRQRGRFEAISGVGRPKEDKSLKLDMDRNVLLQAIQKGTVSNGALN